MLRNFRQVFKDNSTSMGALMVILAAGMLIYLVPSATGQGGQTPDSVIARVYGHEILRQDLDEQIRQEAERYTRGRIQQNALPFLSQQAIKDLVEKRILQELAERRGIVVTDLEVRAAMEAQLSQVPDFIDPATQKLKPYSQLAPLLEERGVNLTEREKLLRGDMVVSKLFEATALQVPVDEQWLAVEDRVRHEKLSFDQAFFKSDTASVADPGDGPLDTYLKAQGARFIQPRRRALQVASVEKADFKDLAADDKQLREAYEQHKPLSGKPAEVKASHILFKASTDAEYAEAMKKAQELRGKLATAADFAKAADEFTQDPSGKGHGGDLGWFSAGKMVKEFNDAAFSLKPGEVSQPVRTSYGIHLIRVATFDEVKDELRGQFTDGLFTTRATEKLEQLRKRANGGDLAAAAKALGVKVALTNPFKEDAAAKVDGFKDASTLVMGAFGMKVGEVSKVENLDGRYLVYRVKEELKPTVPPLKEIRDEVLAAWKQDEADRKLKAQVDEALKNGGFKALAALNPETKSLADTTISAQPALAAHSGIRRALLDTPVGQATPALWGTDGRLWVAQVTDRKPAPALDFTARRALIREIQGQEADRLLGSEVASMESEGALHPGLGSLWGHLGGIWKDEAFFKAFQQQAAAGDQ